MNAGETRLSVDGRDRNGIERLSKLSDGKWHRIDIFQHRKVRKSVVSDSVRITINICFFNENLYSPDRNPVAKERKKLN